MGGDAENHNLEGFHDMPSTGDVDAEVQVPPEDIAVFLDFASCPQHDHIKKTKRTGAENIVFKCGLALLEAIYGHRCNCVLRMSGVPATVSRTYDDRGWPWYERLAGRDRPEVRRIIKCVLGERV